ncbi:MAG: winged helix-turn-helix domain-containing protein [Promethearchaeota archaeon]
MKAPDVQIKYKLWLHKRKNGDILGKGGADLLDAINEFQDLGKATQKMKCSYKYAWNILQKIKERSGKNPVITHRGGAGGGGGMKLSKFGHDLLIFYRKCQNYIETALKKAASELETESSELI